ncbi:unnamed protein product (macronuclear) [Paramecium tetraurelia]|uniref:Uncharacterized protein n=1 Tax=Paramecium tetraurelia TaxID=5888 RepID=A0DH35_PARTE|nr:uncharacterized protein GSPATT00016738001 [Paramecium tetraurelia]CAK82352.1 unnamed protein product [Paramecium tetraurelia]|eukprot:XP_001449749.1 hypothetical protein (macronuclear) [Paramecium tetraurelia strain d4-2]
MKSLSASKYNHNNTSFTTPEKKSNKSRQNTQSTMKLSGEMMSVQSYLYEQAHLKEEASKKEIIRLIRLVIDSLEKNRNIKELNEQHTKLIIGLRTCINQQEVSSYIIQLIQIIREITNNQQFKKEIQTENDKAILIKRIHELELQAQETQWQFEMKIRDHQATQKIKQYQDELEQIKKYKKETQISKPQCNSPQNIELKNQIKLMQQKIQSLSEKEKKLIQLVKAVKSRGIDVEHIYKNINQISSRNSRITKDETITDFVDSSHSDFADISQLDAGQTLIKRNHKFLFD